MNEIVNKFLLAGDKCMSEMHSKQPGLVLLVHSQKRQRKNWKIYADRKYRFYYRNELDKACFCHAMVYGESKDPAKKLNQAEFWEIKLLELQEIQKMMVIKQD